jgi:transposase
MKSSLFIGIDVSKATLDMALESQSSSVKIDNTVSAIRQWLKALPEACYIGVESTGSYHQTLTQLALAAGHHDYLLNSRDLSHYAAALGRRAKTDRLDAQMIARYLKHEHEHLHPYRLPSKIQAQLDALINRRHTAVRAQTMLRQSMSDLPKTLRAFATVMRNLDKLIHQIDQRMRELVAADKTLATHATHLDTVVGFGPLLSHAMANAVTRHPFKNHDAFIAYVGLDPRARDSGQLRGRRFLSKRGPAELRRLLYTAALSACKTKLWRPFYQRYRDKGLSSTAALVVLARKLARVAFSIVKYNTTFKPELIESACAKP